MSDTFGTASEADRAALAEILSHAFAFPADVAPHWFERAGLEHVRSYREGDQLVGGMVVIPMGQYFGGRSVPNLGIAGVGVAPDRRGTGAATRMMHAVLREARATGAVLSTLYPATVPLYRRAGYERAGARYRISLDPRVLDAGSRAGRIEEIPGEPSDVVRDLYARFASRRSGFLDRGPYIWSRVFRPRDSTTKSFLLHGDDGPEGYVVLSHRQLPDNHATEVIVRDLVAHGARATHRALALLADYRSLADEITWHGAAPDLATFLLPERRHDVAIPDFWMLRVVDATRALELRGYPKALAAELTLEIDDDVLPENRGAYRLVVRDGRAEVSPAPRGDLRATARGLAALYAGFLPAATLAEADLLEGSAEALELADALFAGPAPAMADMF